MRKKETELDRLIREQRQDDTPLQRPEPFTTHFRETEYGEDVMGVRDLSAFRERPSECALHRWKYTRQRLNGEWTCTECRRVYDQQYLKDHPKSKSQLKRISEQRKTRYAEDEDYREGRKRSARLWRYKMKVLRGAMIEDEDG